MLIISKNVFEAKEKYIFTKNNTVLRAIRIQIILNQIVRFRKF